MEGTRTGAGHNIETDRHAIVEGARGRDGTWESATPVLYHVALFQSMSHVIRAEAALKGAGVPHKLIPVPRSISSDCGMCIRFLPQDRAVFERALEGLCEAYQIRSLS